MLQKGFIQQRDVVAPRERLEKVSAGRKQRSRLDNVTIQRGMTFDYQEERNKKVTVHTTGKELSLMTSFISKVRERTKISLYEEARYLFVEATISQSEILQEALKMKWRRVKNSENHIDH